MEKKIPGGTAGPFLKWAGGKRQLLPVLNDFFPNIEGTYFEPFLGGGAMYFHLWSTGRLGARAVLSDTCRDLVDAYQGVKNQLPRVIEHLENHAAGYSKNPARYFAAVRKKKPVGAAALAAWVIFLNRTCFNGLYRVNASGEFNSPFGKYKNPKIVREDLLTAAAAALQGASLFSSDFRDVLAFAKAGDVVYLDPPYVPVSATANFTAYTAGGFGVNDHMALLDICKRLAANDVQIILSSSDNPLYREFAKDMLGKGWTLATTGARRNVNSKGGSRGPVTELILFHGSTHYLEM